MLPWVLLLFTLLCGYLTLDSLRFREHLSRSRLVDAGAPMSPTSYTQPLAERRGLVRSFSWSPLSLGQLPWAFGVFTLGFAVATVLAFTA